MKRMFYAAHTPSFRSLSPALPFSCSPVLILFLSSPHFLSRFRFHPPRCRCLSRRAKYIPYLPPITSSLSCYLIRTPPARSRIIINLHARCPTPLYFSPPVTRSSAPSMFSSAITKQVAMRSVILASLVSSSDEYCIPKIMFSQMGLVNATIVEKDYTIAREYCVADTINSICKISTLI